jgi:hypothetical protein
MRVIRALSLLGALAIVGFGPLSGDAAVNEASSGDVPAGTYTYDEAVALGLETPPSDTGLPVCKVDPNWKGFSTPEAAAKIDDGPATCQADPTQVLVSVGYPAPHSGYHYAGFRTTGDWEGGKIDTEVSNPSVDHSVSDQFVVSRVLPVSSSNGNWIEAGWSEVSWRTGRNVYTYRSSQGNWVFYPGYNLNGGSYYPFRSYYCNAGTSGRDECAEIYWSGQWQLLDYDDHTCRLNGNNNCEVEEFVEVHTGDNQAHPDIDGDNAIEMVNTTLLNNAGNWNSWTANSSQGQGPAYDTCHEQNYYRFYAKKNTCP